MKILSLLLLLCSLCFSQQYNNPIASLWFATSFSSTGTPPYYEILPYNIGYASCIFTGYANAYFEIYAQDGVPFVGYEYTPWGSIDINYQYANLIYASTLAYHSSGRSFMAIAFPYDGITPYSLTVQAVSADPASPWGYSASAATYIFR